MDVFALAPAANVVHLARRAALEHRFYSSAMILDMQPVADVEAVAIDGQWLPGQQLADHHGDEFFGELTRPVIVGAVADSSLQSKSVVVSAHQMIRRRFARGVGRIRSVGGRLCKEWVVRT